MHRRRDVYTGARKVRPVSSLGSIADEGAAEARRDPRHEPLAKPRGEERAERVTFVRALGLYFVRLGGTTASNKSPHHPGRTGVCSLPVPERR
jgi:hypothetical protein